MTLLPFRKRGATEDGLWCRGVPKDRVVPGRGGADIGVPLNDSTTIEIPLK